MEAEFIEWLRSRVPSSPCLAIGPGDDAALVQLPGGQLLATVDLLTDGVDFVLSSADPRRIGRKALAVNLSDLAAMAAQPVAALVALALPRAGSAALARELFEGLLPLADKYGVAIAGGDTNTWDGPLVISITLFGTPTAAGVLERRGAKPGDWIVVTGAFGGSLLGKHFDFEPRVREALALKARFPLHAGIDVSDGLSLDLGRLARESGCGAVVDLDQVPVSPAAHLMAAEDSTGRSPLDHALSDGEDFELVLAVPPEAAKRMLNEQPIHVPLTAIGHFIAEPGLWQAGLDGSRTPLAERGYQH